MLYNFLLSVVALQDGGGYNKIVNRVVPYRWKEKNGRIKKLTSFDY